MSQLIQFILVYKSTMNTLYVDYVDNFKCISLLLLYFIFK